MERHGVGGKGERSEGEGQGVKGWGGGGRGREVEEKRGAEVGGLGYETGEEGA